ncbi:hypothetical protein [Mongoliimonas terrestris]|nr:hypothetical protein [Mongoliimonas terrestris]
MSLHRSIAATGCSRHVRKGMPVSPFQAALAGTRAGTLLTIMNMI